MTNEEIYDLQKQIQELSKAFTSLDAKIKRAETVVRNLRPEREAVLYKIITINTKLDAVDPRRVMRKLIKDEQ